MVRIEEILSQQPEIADEVQIGSSGDRAIGPSEDQPVQMTQSPISWRD